MPLDVCTRRDRSNSPLQALTLLNDPVFAEMADMLGNRIMNDAGPTDEARIQYAIRLCLARSADESEVMRLKQYLADEGAQSESRRWSNLAGVLLNLHEFITRD